MNGLDAIINKITDDADKVCMQLTENAKTDARAIISEKKKQAEFVADKIINEALEKKKSILSNAALSVDAIKKRVVLEAKSEIISAWTEYCKDYYKKLDGDMYFEFIKNCAIKVGKIHEKEKCGILLSQNNINRLPNNFVEVLNNIANIEICDVVITPKLDYGFILDFDGILENCTVDALFDDKFNEIGDSLYKLINA